jgi:hypothetical protein
MSGSKKAARKWILNPASQIMAPSPYFLKPSPELRNPLISTAISVFATSMDTCNDHVDPDIRGKSRSISLNNSGLDVQ